MTAEQQIKELEALIKNAESVIEKKRKTIKQYTLQLLNLRVEKYLEDWTPKEYTENAKNDIVVEIKEVEGIVVKNRNLEDYGGI